MMDGEGEESAGRQGNGQREREEMGNRGGSRRVGKEERGGEGRGGMKCRIREEGNKGGSQPFVLLCAASLNRNFFETSELGEDNG